MSQLHNRRSSTSAKDGTGGYPLPVPIDLPDLDGAQLRRRALQTARVIARNFAPVLAKKVLRQELPEKAGVRPLRKSFEELGATYVKFGQLLSSSPGVFGEDVADEFRTCLDAGPPVPFWKIRKIVERDLGRPLEEIYPEFSREPIAAASIAVVHQAILADGRQVAVKVLRPGIETTVAADLDLMEPVFTLLARQIGVGLAGPLLQLLEGFREQVAEEMDFRNEMRTMLHHRHMLKRVHLPYVVIPEPFEDFSGRNVLTMEFLDGVPIDDLSGIARFEVDPRPIVEEVVKAWFITTIRNGTFHGDVHAGNLMLLRDGRMGVLDWGIVGRLSPDAHQFMRWVIEAALGDESAWEKIANHVRTIYGAGVVESLGLTESEMTDLIRQQIEPLLTQPFGQVSLATMFMGPQDKLGEAQAERISRQSPVQVIRNWRNIRKVRHVAVGHGGVGSDFDRGTFLIGKQLLYFERYGKMFLSDISLLEDEDFFKDLLEQEPIE